MKSWIRSKYTVLLAVLAGAAGYKTVLIAAGVVPFNSDEAIVALMARHILQGERPVFFYGQAYMGSLDAFLVAGGFWIFGEHIWVMRMIQGLLYLGVLGTTAWIGAKAFGSLETGILAAGLLAVPTVNVTLYTTATLGGYGEALLIGNLIVLSGLRIANKLNRENGKRVLKLWLDCVLLGFLCGFGLWTLGITIVYAIPVVVLLIVSFFKNEHRSWGRGAALVAGSLAGFLVGSLPWWLYATQSGLQSLVGELLGSAVSVEGANFAGRLFQHLINIILLGIPVITGMRPPWGVRWLALPLIPVILVFWGLVCVYVIRQVSRNRSSTWMPWVFLGMILTLTCAFLLTSFGIDPTGRYFVPLAIPLALFAADFIRSIRGRPRVWRTGLVGLLIAFSLVGTIQCAIDNPPGLTTQFNPETLVDHRQDPQLIEFLLVEGITRGYTNYWVSYPLAFLSAEQIIFTPRLPYHLDLRYTLRDDRYPPYGELVSQTNRPAFITTGPAALDNRLRQTFRLAGANWKEKVIGDYTVFYDLSKEISLGSLSFG